MDPQGNAADDERATTSIHDRLTSRSSVRVGAVILLILILTLTPSRDNGLHPLAFNFPFDLHGIADDLLNLALFVPLGLAINWRSRRVPAAILVAFLLSTAIELLQTIVPGRDPSLSDVVFNTLGAAIGALAATKPRAWLLPRSRISLVLAIAATLGAAVLMAATTLVRSTVGHGWPILPGSERVSHDWIPLLNGTWVLALCIPAGFWSRGRLWVVTASAMAILLWIIPRITDASPTGYMEWMGMIGGFIIGAGLRSLARSYDDSGAASSATTR